MSSTSLVVEPYFTEVLALGRKPQQSPRAFAWSKLLWSFGGHGRDRTDDLFHAMELDNQVLIDGKELSNGQSR